MANMRASIPALDVGDTAGDDEDKNPCFHGAYVLV